MILHGSFYIRLVIVGVTSWLLGVVAYLTSLYIVYGQTAEGADFRAVLIWSFIGTFLTLHLIHAPILLLLRRWLGGCKPMLAFPLMSSLVFIIPTMFIFWMFSISASNFFQSLMTSEALLFSCLFVVVGVSFGLGFVWCCRKNPI